MEKLLTYLKEELGIEISASQISDFGRFEQLLVEWNEKFNLTSITGSEAIQIKHFFDSLTCLKVIKSAGGFSLIDIGTGAGFPGIPLKIIRPDIILTLVESSQKKTGFCKKVIDTLKLTNTVVLATRAEDLGKDPNHREQYDWAVARAVAELPVLVEYLLPLVKVGGCALAMKGFEMQDEINKSRHAIAILGGEISEIMSVTLPDGYGERTLIAIKKITSTSNAYPRRVGIPQKKPII